MHLNKCSVIKPSASNDRTFGSFTNPVQAASLSNKKIKLVLTNHLFFVDCIFMKNELMTAKIYFMKWRIELFAVLFFLIL